MKMRKIFILSVLFSKIYAQTNMEILEEYRDELCTILVNTSNSIDDYFIDDDSHHLQSKTYAKFSTSVAMESHQKFEHDMRLRLRLNLPKIQKNLRIVFEDENNDNSLYDRTTLNDEKLRDKSYYLRVEYLKLIKKKFNFGLGVGLRVRQGNLVPYLNFRSRYNLFKNESFKSVLRNRFRYYSDGEIEDTFEFNNLYIFDSSVYAILRNQLSYSNKDNDESTYHDLSLIKKLTKKKKLSVGMGVRSNLVHFKEYAVEYYHIHTLYHHLFYKNWLYYQVAPSALWRENNNFSISYRLMLNFGILFKK
jgi:hypothetical protein